MVAFSGLVYIRDRNSVTVSFWLTRATRAVIDSGADSGTERPLVRLNQN